MRCHGNLTLLKNTLCRNRACSLKTDLHYYGTIHIHWGHSTTGLLFFLIAFCALTGATHHFSIGSMKMRSDNCHKDLRGLLRKGYGERERTSFLSDF